MASGSETKRIAKLHMEIWTCENAHGSTLFHMIGAARKNIADCDLLIDAYAQTDEPVPQDITDDREFWIKYKDWANGIIDEIRSKIPKIPLDN